ncbi:MAG: DNA cytosine methyltransferase, partial [bacterium]
MAKTIKAADLFCGAGGTSTGLYLAAEKLKRKIDLLAVNHWPIAIDTHSANHLFARHMCESLDKVNPREVVPEGKLDILVASPECTHHSVARGGRPINDQSRASAWHVLRWAEALMPRIILIENVREFRTWGPIGTNKRPLKSRKGETYHAFLNSLRSLGYRVEDKVLNAANYGDPTTRERLFIIALKGNRHVHWPEPTHTETGENTLFGKTKKWRTARDIIEWDRESRSIFTRKRPLSPNTMRRIFAGLEKFSGLPFLAMLYGTNDARSVDRPAPTVTGGGGHMA